MHVTCGRGQTTAAGISSRSVTAIVAVEVVDRPVGLGATPAEELERKGHAIVSTGSLVRTDAEYLHIGEGLRMKIQLTQRSTPWKESRPPDPLEPADNRGTVPFAGRMRGASSPNGGARLRLQEALLETQCDRDGERLLPNIHIQSE
jgi:hypothetical protein